MKTEEILNLDYRKIENKEIIQKVLVKIKPLAKHSGEEVPIEALEKLVGVLTTKYEVCPQWITLMSDEKGNPMYSVGVKSSKDHKWLSTVYGMCMYELFAKLSIQMYSYVKSGKVKRKQPTEEEAQRKEALLKVKESE